jgi:hypothetical protein
LVPPAATPARAAAGGCQATGYYRLPCLPGSVLAAPADAAPPPVAAPPLPRGIPAAGVAG